MVAEKPYAAVVGHSSRLGRKCTSGDDKHETIRSRIEQAAQRMVGRGGPRHQCNLCWYRSYGNGHGDERRSRQAFGQRALERTSSSHG